MSVGVIGVKGSNVIVPVQNLTKKSKQYSLTVTGENWTTTRAVGVAYADSTGAWRLKFNIDGTATGAMVTMQLSVADVVFKNESGYYPACSAFVGGEVPYLASAQAVPNTDDIVIYFANTTNPGIQVSGDVELNAEPTWYAANAENIAGVDVYVPPETFLSATGATGGTATINFDNGTVQKLVLMANTAITLQSTDTVGSYLLLLFKGATGAAATWDTTVEWPGGSAPTLTTAWNSVDIISLVLAGGSWWGTYNLDMK